MTILQKQTKRKVSCMPCRLKKVKCDGGQPCTRCTQRQCDSTCVYKDPGPVGRPPKNAVVNKLVLSHQTKASFCKEFIFERTPVVNDAKFLCNGADLGLEYHLNSIFCEYFDSGPRHKAPLIRRKAEPPRWVAQLKIYDLCEYFAWGTADFVSTLLRRISRLPLEHHIGLEFTANGLAGDKTCRFFEPPQTDKTPLLNPLNSLPPEQVLRLLDMFFTIHPYSFIVSKALLLQRYWSDTEDPLLLSVVFGVTIYKSQMLDGKPLGLWRATSSATRNHFLDYAYTLLSRASTEVTLHRYQAVVLLALFEATYGFPKRGLALFALSYMIAGKLLGGYHSLSIPGSIDSVEREMLLNTFWVSNNCTVRGAAELGYIPRSVLVVDAIPYPPISVQTSLICQYDEANGHSHMVPGFQHYVESFYSQVVISNYSCQIMACLPDSKDIKTRSRLQSLTDLKIRIGKILDDFAAFIEKQRQLWSPIQSYIIHTTWQLYCVYFFFPRPGSTRDNPLPVDEDSLDPPVIGPKEDESIESNPNDMQRLDQIMPLVNSMLLDTQQLLLKQVKSGQGSQFFPRGLIISALEGSARLLILKIQRDPWDDVAYGSLETILMLSELDIWNDWTTIKVVIELIKRFSKTHVAHESNNASTPMQSSDASLAPGPPWLDLNVLDLDLLLWDSVFTCPKMLTMAETPSTINNAAPCLQTSQDDTVENGTYTLSSISNSSFVSTPDSFTFPSNDQEQQTQVDRILMDDALLSTFYT